MSTTYIFDKNSGRCYDGSRKNPYTHCIVYWDGGKESGKWVRSSAMTKEEASQASEDMKKTHPWCRCMVVDYQKSLKIGLPEVMSSGMMD